MVSWLENSDDKLSDLELWGVEKSDLFEWLDNDGVGLRGAGKGKEKEVAEGKAKEKGKEKRKDKGKGREKEVTGGKKKKVRMDK